MHDDSQLTTFSASLGIITFPISFSESLRITCSEFAFYFALFLFMPNMIKLVVRNTMEIKKIILAQY